MKARRVVVTVVAAAVLGLTGCGPDESSSAGTGGQSPTGDGGESTAPSAEPSSEPSEEASEDPFAGVVPASGDELVLDSVHARAPKGWDVRKLTSQHVSAAKDLWFLALRQYGPVRSMTLDEEAKQAQRPGVTHGRLARDPDVTVAGQQWFRVSGRSTSDEWVLELGTQHDDSFVRLGFEFPPQVGEAKREELMSSVLATVEWH